MAFSVSILHKATLMSHYPAYRRFRELLKDPRAIQEKMLAMYLNKAAASGAAQDYFRGKEIPSNYVKFKDQARITSYDDWESSIQKQRSLGGRFEPTSGSTHRCKWIPYPKTFLSEFDRAASAWIYDLSKQHPAITKGKHYWSVSWLPKNLREKSPERSNERSNDDMEIFPPWKRWIAKSVLAVDPHVSQLPSLEDSLFATVTQLAACSDLSLISVWSPTFALELLNLLSAHRQEVAGILKARGLKKRASLLLEWNGKLESGFFSHFWPALAVVSCWDSSTSIPWARKLGLLFPNAALQGKGLWATEGVVTFPFEGKYPAAIQSHFFEFRCLTTGKIVPLWELSLGQRVQPLLTTGSGFFRYALEDELEVTDFLMKTPCFRFLGRMNGLDLVGEKLATRVAQDLLVRVSSEFGIDCITLLGHSSKNIAEGIAKNSDGNAIRESGYTLLAEGDMQLSQKAAQRAEEILMEFHHYRLARELKQLIPVKGAVMTGALDFYNQIRGSVEVSGGRKVEALVPWNY